MSQALQYLYYIYDGFINLVFNQIEIADGVSIGWVMISIVLFSLIIRSVLNLPRGISLHPVRTTETRTIVSNDHGVTVTRSTRRRL